MMREKIKIRKIDYLPARQVTFSKRRSGDLKKAGEMSILCESEVVVIILSQTGKLLDFSSSSYGFYGRRLESSTFIFMFKSQKARDAKDRLETVASQAHKMNDIVTEQWIQIQRLEQAFHITQDHEVSKASEL